ncbi:MAG: hydroxyacid dehydrogenase [Armatimonadota bacterium]|nr:hydroxyacid dehydrogenase [Armatimonadota bacterium]
MTKILCTMPELTYRRMRLPEQEADLNALGEVVFCLDAKTMGEQEYDALWENADAVLTGWGTRPPSPAVLERAKNLRVISHTAGSVRWLPRRALECGIIVTSAQAGIARTVAEYCLLSAILLLRRHSDLLAGGRPPTETLYGKTVGLVGFGHVARLFRQLLVPFGCRALVSDPALSEEDTIRFAVERTDLPTLLASSKIISLHAPDIPSTRGLIGARELALIADGAVFLNSARGCLVDTDALTDALKTGRFAAALDVTEPEPLPLDHPLRGLPNVVLTPHIAGPTDDDLPEMTRMALDDLARVLGGVPPRRPISLETYDAMSF